MLKNNFQKLKRTKESHYRLGAENYEVIFKKEGESLIIIVVGIGRKKEVNVLLNLINALIIHNS